jgi:hypothetical protein
MRRGGRGGRERGWGGSEWGGREMSCRMTMFCIAWYGGLHRGATISCIGCTVVLYCRITLFIYTSTSRQKHA